MKLDNVRMEALLPSWMRDNPDIQALAAKADEETRKIYAQAQLLTTWDKLDQLPEEVLDRLAWELDIDWYDVGAPVETKVALIRDSDFVHAHKGTVAAVEKVIRAYFGDDKLMEWPEYGGDPHHFKVYTHEPTLVQNNLEQFLAMLEKVKRHSSKLDGILIGLTGQQYAFLCNGARDFAYERQYAGVDRIYVWGTVGHVEQETICVSMGETSPFTPQQAEQAMNDERRVTPWVLS